MKISTLVWALGTLLLTGAIISLLLPTAGLAQPLPKVTIGIDKAQKPQDVAVTLEILFLLTILSLAPAFMILVTSFTRIIVVFHFLRQALGLQQMPPNQVLIGLALFLTFFIMNPVFRQINDKALRPYTKGQISYDQAFKRGIEPLRTFMMKQTREKDLALFVSLSRTSKPKNANEVPTHVLIPAFVVSELRIAFQIGFLLYIPFLVIDIIVASVLMSMGMLMLPPVMISLPFKILLFVLVDGWYLVVGSIIRSFA
ncbi:flagellar type III secretion system pore protein FliP [bacterium]|nr:flagellar type III secretion system pore protein FliP [bacterium]